MFVELQLSSEAFSRIVRNNLRLMNPCQLIGLRVPLNRGVPIFNIQRDENGKPITTDWDLVDHIEILGTAFRREDPTKSQVFTLTSPGFSASTWAVPFMQVLQTVRLHTVRWHDLETHGAKPSPAATIDIALVLDVSLAPAESNIKDRRPILSCSLRDTIPSTPELKAQLPTITFTRVLDIRSLTGVLERPVEVRNAGITCFTDTGSDGNERTFVIARLDIDLAESGPNVTRAFFEEEQQQYGLDGKDWALLVDRTILCSQGKQTLKDGLTKHPDKIKFDGDLEAAWQPPNTLDVSCEARPVVAGQPTLDVEVTVSTTFTLSPSDQDTLVTSSSISLGRPAGVSVAQWVPFALAGELWVSLVVEMLWAIVTPAIDVTGQMKDELERKHCVITDKKKFRCEHWLKIELFLYGNYRLHFTVESVGGNDRGLILSGSILGLTDLATPQGTVTASNFAWTLNGNCSSGYSIANEAEIEVGGDAHICAVTRLDDDPGGGFSFVPDPPKLESGKITIHANFAAPNATWLVDPLCIVYLRTTTGLRIIKLGPPKPITKDEHEALTKMIGFLKHMCQKLQDSITISYEKPGPPPPLELPDWLPVAWQTTLVTALAALSWLPFQFRSAIASQIGLTAANVVATAALLVGIAAVGTYLNARRTRR